MKEIDLDKGVNEFYYNIFKNLVGKYMFREYGVFKKEIKIYVLIERVYFDDKGRAKIKLRLFQKGELLNGTCSLICNLNTKWIVLTKKEFKRRIILDSI